jgi:hypothetical protein
MEPVRIEDGVAIFTSNQLEEYGFPEWYGFEIYRIIETRECIEMVTDFHMEEEYCKRPIHRYCRRKRFQNTLANLLNDKGKVPRHIVEMVREEMFPNREIWDEVRTVLKQHKLRIYYNRIPFIIQQLDKVSSTQPVKSHQYQAIMKEFDQFCFWFDQNKHQMKRTYFPNMRFIALKLMERYGVQLNYEIPFTRTLRKRKDLEQIWVRFILQ